MLKLSLVFTDTITEPQVLKYSYTYITAEINTLGKNENQNLGLVVNMCYNKTIKIVLMK